MTRDIDDLVQTVQDAHRNGVGVTLLIGAGCSVKAGIPLADEFVERIRERYPRAYGRAVEKSYTECMRQLGPGHRRDLIASYVRNARINWAHVCIALLMKHGYVGRVLTTNFDNLTVRACALLGEFPAVYDLAALQTFNPADIPDKAVFHLHGQHTGSSLLNTKEEMEKQFEFLGPVFEDNDRRRTWIVVGYSGNDPVFTHLAKVSQFKYELYWVGYRNSEPAEHVRSRLLHPDKYAFYLGGYDADSFFVTLTQKLGLFPPSFVGDPFTYVADLLETLTSFGFAQDDMTVDVTRDARERILRAREAESERTRGTSPSQDGVQSDVPLRTQILTEFMAANYTRVIELAQPHIDELPGEIRDLVTWSYIRSADGACDDAAELREQEADAEYEKAVEYYRESLRVSPHKHEALYNWGNALFEWASKKHGSEADRLWKEAEEKYREAVRIMPDKFKALNNWGLVLTEIARGTDSEEADEVFSAAAEKFSLAVAVKPNMAEALNNWGTTLALWGRTKGRRRDAIPLFTEGMDRYRAAIRIKPDFYEALNNLAVLLLAVVDDMDSVVQLEMYAEVEELLTRVETIYPGKGAYNLACFFARRGNEAKAREWLESSVRQEMLPPRDLVMSDPDLKSIREAVWFKVMFESEVKLEITA